MERRVNVRGIIIDDDGMMFAVKHRDRRTGGETEFWATVGGGLDQNESLEEGLAREFEEEIGITPAIGRILFVQQFIANRRNSSQTEKLEFFFHVTNTDDFKEEIDLGKTSHGHELARVGFVNPRTDDVLPAFLTDIDIRQHIDTNQPVRIVNNLKEKSRS